MDDSTKTMMLTLASGVIKKGLLGLGVWAATHGVISSSQVESFVGAGMLLVSVAWSLWNDYGKAIVLSKLEVLKAQSLAQAAKLRQAGVAPPSAAEIAAQHPSLTPADVVKQAVIVKVLLAAVALSFLAFPGSAFAQTARSRPVAAAPAAETPAASEPTSKCLIPWDPLKLCGTLTGKPDEDMQRVVKRIQQVGRDDMNYAILKATQANTNGSKVRLQCLQAILAAKNAAEGTDIKDSSGAVVPRPDPAIVTTLEDTAELVDALSTQGPLMTSCAGAAQLFKLNALQMVNAFVTGAMGIAALPAGL